MGSSRVEGEGRHAHPDPALVDRDHDGRVEEEGCVQRVFGPHDGPSPQDAGASHGQEGQPEGTEALADTREDLAVEARVAAKEDPAPALQIQDKVHLLGAGQGVGPGNSVDRRAAARGLGARAELFPSETGALGELVPGSRGYQDPQGPWPHHRERSQVDVIRMEMGHQHSVQWPHRFGTEPGPPETWKAAQVHAEPGVCEPARSGPLEEERGAADHGHPQRVARCSGPGATHRCSSRWPGS